jgi:hypothetical protein
VWPALQLDPMAHGDLTKMGSVDSVRLDSISERHSWTGQTDLLVITSYFGWKHEAGVIETEHGYQGFGLHSLSGFRMVKPVRNRFISTVRVFPLDHRDGPSQIPDTSGAD